MSVETEKVGLANGRAPARRLRWRALAVFAVLNLVAVGLVAAPSQAQIVTCDGTMADQTVDGTLVVPNNGFCDLQNVVVDGRVTVHDGGTLFLTASRIRSSLTAGFFTLIQTSDSRVDGMTSLGDQAVLDTYSSRYNRLVDVQGGLVNSVDSTHWGGIRSVNGETIINAGFVVGAVSTDGDFVSELYDTAVFGPISVRNATFGTTLCHLGAALSVTANGNDDVVQVGNGPYASCGFNLFGSLTVNNNTADIFINRNIVGGNLECVGNDPAPHGSFNLVGGSRIGQCSSLTPAPSAASTTIGELEPAPRDDHIQSVIESRLARL